MKKHNIVKKQAFLLVCLLCFASFASLASAASNYKITKISFDKTSCNAGDTVVLTISYEATYSASPLDPGRSYPKLIFSGSASRLILYAVQSHSWAGNIKTFIEPVQTVNSGTLAAYFYIYSDAARTKLESTGYASVTVNSIAPTVSIVSNKNPVGALEPFALTISSTNAVSLAINGEKKSTTSGTFPYFQTIATKYTAIATNSLGQTAVQSVTVAMKSPPPPPKPPIISFTGSPSSIVRGSSATLSWTVQYATSIFISNTAISGSTKMSGTCEVSPTEKTTYILTAIGPDGTITASKTIDVSEPYVPPTTYSLSLDLGKTTIAAGETTYIRWRSEGYSSVYSDDFSTNGQLSGQVDISPDRKSVV